MSFQKKRESGARKLLQSGIIFSAINFLIGLGNLAFQSVMGHLLTKGGQYSHANSAINAFTPLLALPPQVAMIAVTHYIAHFHALGDTARLQALLGGCRKFLLHLTIFGSVLAILVAKPLSLFFHYSTSLLLVTLLYTLLALWASFATALCQGLAWFNRLALIGFLVMLLKVTGGYFATLRWPAPETFVLASTFALLANLILLYWRKDLSLTGGQAPASPWNHEFTLYLTISAAVVVGNYCFSLSDLLVMQRYFSDTSGGDAYTAVERLAIALPTTVSPLLSVLFTNRSVEHTADALRAQLKLIGLYAAGLCSGAVALFVLRHPCLALLHKDTPEAAGMISHLAVAMVFVGLLQAMGTWALASRWSRISLLYGALSLAYTTLLLLLGQTPAALLRTMPLATGAAFLILFTVWFGAMRRHKPVA
jgi:hypothetical protein